MDPAGEVAEAEIVKEVKKRPKKKLKTAPIVAPEHFIMATLEVEEIEWNLEENTPNYFGPYHPLTHAHGSHTAAKNTSTGTASKRQSCAITASKSDISGVMQLKLGIYGDDVFSILANELVLKIFSYLCLRSLLYCSRVCRQWRRLACDAVLWKRLNLLQCRIQQPYLMNMLQRGVKVLCLNQTHIYKEHQQQQTVNKAYANNLIGNDNNCCVDSKNDESSMSYNNSQCSSGTNNNINNNSYLTNNNNRMTHNSDVTTRIDNGNHDNSNIEDNTSACCSRTDICEELALTHLDATLVQCENNTLLLLLQRSRNLVRLSLEGCAMSPAQCLAISYNKKLLTLNLCLATGLTSSSVDIITKRCVLLKSLNLAWTGLGKDSVKFISRCAHLDELNLSGLIGGLTTKVVEKLVSSCRGLLNIDLSDVHLEMGILRLIQQYCTKIRKLSISRCRAIISDRVLELADIGSLTHVNMIGFMNHDVLEEFSRKRPDVHISKEPFSPISRPITTELYNGKIWDQYINL